MYLTFAWLDLTMTKSLVLLFATVTPTDNLSCASNITY